MATDQPPHPVHSHPSVGRPDMISLSHARPSPIWQGNASEGICPMGLPGRATATKSSRGTNNRKSCELTKTTAAARVARMLSLENRIKPSNFDGFSRSVTYRDTLCLLSSFLFSVSLLSPFSEKARSEVFVQRRKNHYGLE